MPLPRSIRFVDVAFAVWAALWLLAGVVVYDSLRQLEDGGRAVVTAGEGLDETSLALDRAARGLHQTSETLGVLGQLPFLPENPGAAVEQTARDVEQLAIRVRQTAADARTTGAAAAESARTLAVVLGLAVALAPTLGLLLLYLVLRPLVAAELRRRR